MLHSGEWNNGALRDTFTSGQYTQSVEAVMNALQMHPSRRNAPYCFATLQELDTAFSSSSLSTMEAFRCACAAVEKSRTLGDLANNVVSRLGLIYPNVLLFSWRNPEMRLWTSVIRRGSGAGMRWSHEVGEQSPLRYVVDAGLCFYGRLPDDSALRVALGPEISSETLLVPIRLYDTTVSLLLIDAGYSRRFAPPGGELQKLYRTTVEAMERLTAAQTQTPQAQV